RLEFRFARMGGTNGVHDLFAEDLGIFLDVAAKLISFEEEAAGVARHTRNAGFHALVRTTRVGDYLRRPLVDALALGVHEHVGLQAVGQMKYHLAAGRLKRGGAGVGSEWMLEKILASGVVGKIVAAPESAVGSVVALEKAVVLGNP